MSYRVVDAAGCARPCADLLDALALVRAPGGSRVEHTRDGALLAIRGRVPRETARLAPQEIAVERTPDQNLVERAVARAGSLRALATEIGRENAGPDLSKARTARRPLTGPLRALLLKYCGDEDGGEAARRSPRASARARTHADLQRAYAERSESGAPGARRPGRARLVPARALDGPHRGRALHLRRAAAHRGRVMGRPSVTPQIVALVAAHPAGLSAKQIADAIGCGCESVRIPAKAAMFAGRIERRLAPPSANGARWLYYPVMP